jgi:hypothetical protein
MGDGWTAMVLTSRLLPLRLSAAQLLGGLGDIALVLQQNVESFNSVGFTDLLNAE